MKRLVLIGCVLLVAATFVGTAGASHLRYSSISAQSTGGDIYAFDFSMGQAGCSTIGTPFSLLQLNFGDATSPATPAGAVSAIQCLGLFQWQFGPATIAHTYDASLDGTTVTASSNGSCRVSLNNAPFSCTMRSEVSFVVGTGDSTPTMSVPPVVYCKTAETCTFSIPATDIDSNQLRWRMSTDAEMGGTANPSGMSVAPTTGLMSWDTTGKADGLWAANVTVEELNMVGAAIGKTAADFIIALGNYDKPLFVAPTPADGSTLTATVGQPFSLQLAATPPATKTAVLSTLGVPAWLICPFALTADPATVTCAGTPTAAGSTQLVFLATASDGPQTGSSYTLTVAAAPVATAPPAPAPVAAPAPPAPPPPTPPLLVQPVTTDSGYVSGTGLSIHVGNAVTSSVLVSTTADLASPIQFDVAADGTIAYPVPPGVEGKITLYVVRPSDGSIATVSFDVDTKAPLVISVEHVVRPPSKVVVSDGHSAPTVAHDPLRKFFQIRGVDSGSGIVSLQLEPSGGATWTWRSFITRFSAPIVGTTIRVRIRDAAGNVSSWFRVPVRKLK